MLTDAQPTQARARRLPSQVCACLVLMLAAVGCGNGLPRESELPPESALAFPGAVEVRRSFNDGETGTYIDGGSADYAPRLNASYGLTGVDRDELFDWYEDQLQQLGWTITRRSERDLGATKDPDGDLHFNLGITAASEDFDTYSVVLVLASDD